MAEWKKVIVSGSSAHLTSLQIDDLVSGVVTGSSDGTLGIQAINGTGNIVATTGASGVEISGSFSGSFQGDGSALTNISSTSIVGLTQIATGSVTASVNVETNAFTVASESIQLFNVRANGGVEHGNAVTASGAWSHAEGGSGGSITTLQAIGDYSHAEGYDTIAYGNYSHAEGELTVANAEGAHAEGYSTLADGDFSHTEGYFTTASGDYSHAEGNNTVASGSYSHAEGIGTIASGSGQLAAGRYNTHNNVDSLVVIGNGTDDANRSDLALFNSQSIIFNQPVTGSIFSGSFSGSFFGTTNLPDLTEGTGIEAFTYDGGATATVSVSGAASLSSDTITKWTGTAFADTSITDDGTLITFGNDALFEGDIIVQGTASFQNTENLLVADRFVLFASGSVAGGDGGIVVQQGTQNVGELFGYENSSDRWGFTSSFDAASTSYTPSAFVAAVVDVDGGQSDIAQYQKNGNIKIQSGDIWIYA
jgi:hypothetical protein